MAGEKLISKALQAIRKTDPLGFYSKAAEEAAALKQAKGTPEQMRAMLLKQGVKPDELKWTGFDTWAQGKKSVTKDEIVDFLEKNRVQIGEKRLGEGERSPAKYSDYVIPGGTNYRELLLTRPTEIEKLVTYPVVQADGRVSGQYASKEQAAAAAERLGGVVGDPITTNMETGYRSSHWKGDLNPVAHLRMSDRVDPEGKRVLHLEELQSDWAQEGRKKGFSDPVAYAKWAEQNDATRDALRLAQKAHEDLVSSRFPREDVRFRPGQESPREFENRVNAYEAQRQQALASDPDFQASAERMWQATNARASVGTAPSREGVPSGPFVESTPKWTDLALKRALREAAEGGYDRLAWTPGAEQAKRFDLSTQIGKVQYYPDRQAFRAFDLQGNPVIDKSGVTPEQIADYIGKEPAQRLLAPEAAASGPVSIQELRGLDLQTGGEGMKGYYDKIVPTQLQKLTRDLDPNAQFGTLGMYRNPEDLQSLQRGLPSLESVRDNWAAMAASEGSHPAYRQQAQDQFQHMQNVIDRHNADIQKQMADKIDLPSLTITPEMREKIKQGLPLFTAPAIGLGAATQMQSGEPPVADEPRGFADGGTASKPMTIDEIIARIRSGEAQLGEFDPRIPQLDANRAFQPPGSKFRNQALPIMPTVPYVPDEVSPRPVTIRGERPQAAPIPLPVPRPADSVPAQVPRPRSFDAAPAVQPAEDVVSRALWAAYNESESPADFLRADEAMRAGRAGGGKTIQKALRAVSELFESPGMEKWREGSKIPASRVEDRYFTGTSKDKDFANFNVGRHGAWFTKDPAEASMYARENDSKGYRREGWNMVPTNTADRVIPAFLRSENPFTGPLPDMVRAENYKKAQSDWFDQLRSQGHDAWMPESNPNLAVILRDPSNIKSAISNSGDFDLGSPRIDRASGGRLLSDQYPTSYMPNVGRQVMADGGNASTMGGFMPQQFEEAPDDRGERFQRALQNYRNFPQQPGEAVARPLERDVRDVIGGAIAGDQPNRSYGTEMRRRAADLAVGSTGMRGSGTLGFGLADLPAVTGLPLMASDIAGSAGRGDYAEAALGAALPAAFYARKPIGKALDVARDALGRVPAPVAAGASAAAVMSPDEAEAGTGASLARRVMRGSDLIAKDPKAADVVLSKRDLSGSDKTGMRVKDVEYAVTPKGDLQPYQRFNPEDMYRERGYVIPALGDRSAAGRNLEEIGGVKLTSPVSQQGGGEFMRSTEDPAIWASRKGPVKSMYGQLQRQMKEQGASEDAPIFMSHTLMGYPSLDSTNMMAEAILRQIQPTMGRIDPKAAEKVDAFIKRDFPDWPGILNPEEAEKFLKTNEVGKRTSSILQALDKADAVRGGLPNLGAARFATMDPRLVSADQLSSGFAISRLDPRGKGMPTEHGTYTAGMAGDYRGGTDYQIPARLMYPDWFNKMNPEYLEKKSGKMKATSPTMYQQGLLTQFPLQKTTQEWLDNIMAHTEREGKKWGYRDGGLVYE